MKNPLPLKALTILTGACLAAQFASANTALWVGTNSVTVTTNWSDNLNWSNSAGGSPGFTNNDVVFGDFGSIATAATINNVVDTTGQTLSLTYTNESHSPFSAFHTTLIPGGATLTNANTLLVGVNSAVNGYLTTVNMVGGGTLLQKGAAMTVKNIGSANSSGALATLDMSGLSNFVYSVGGGTLTVASAAAGSEARGGGVLTLANGSNYISIGTIALALGTGNGGSTANAINLGPGTNVINVGTVTVSAGKINTAKITWLDSTGGLRLRGAGGTDADRVNIILGSRGNTGTGTILGSLLFNGHPVDVKAGSIVIGRSTSNQSGQVANGVLEFDNGTIDATSISMAECSGNVGATVNGTLTVAGTAKLVVGNVSLVNQTLGIATGNLVISSGLMTCLGNITKGTNAGTANLTIDTGGKLAIEGAGKIGSVAAPVDNLNLTDGTLQLTPAGNGTNVVVTTLTTGGAGNTIQIDSMPSITGYPTTLRLIKYSGAIAGSGFNFTLTGLPGVFTGSLVDNAANSSVDLVVTSGPVAQALKWNGNLSDDWNILGTKNWRFGVIGTNYFDGDFVTFDDTASGTTTVDLTTELAPGNLTVNNSSLSYAFIGPGRLSGLSGLVKQGSGSLLINNAGVNDFGGAIEISSGTLQVGNGATSGSLGGGAISNNATLTFNRSDDVSLPNAIAGTSSGTLTKNGAGVLTLSSANTFTGAVTVAQGTLKTGNSGALGRTNGATTINSGATLDFGANAVNIGQEPVSVSGSGVTGNGAIINSSASPTFVAANVARVTLTGPTTFGGSGRWDLRSATTTDPSGASLSTGGQPYTLTKKGTNQVSIVGVTVDPALGDVDVQAGILGLEAATTGLGNPANNLTVQPGATLQFFNLTNLFNKLITVNGTATNNAINNSSGANTVIGPMTLNGNCIINAGGTSLTLSNTITGGGSLIKSGGNTLVLTGGDDNYSGTTTVSNGTLIVNNVLNGGGTLTVLTNGTLGGTGSYPGPVTVAGTLAPGMSAGTFSSGPLTLSAGATLSFELSPVTTIGSAVNDLLVVSGNLTANNNSIVINLLGGSLAAGTYRLINYSGTLSGTFNPTVTIAGGAARYSFTLDAGTLGQVNLVVGGSPGKVRWDSFASSTWDIGISSNWFNLGSSATDAFFQADTVLFDDTPGLVTSIEITNGAVVAPSAITNDSTIGGNNFRIAGPGRIAGGAGIVKLGDSTLTLLNTNTHTGGLIANGGSVRLVGISSGGSGLLTVNSGATLVLGAAHSNSITVVNGTVGVVTNDFTTSTTSEFIVPAGTTATLQAGDPQSPDTSPHTTRNLQIDGTLRGSGNIIARNAQNVGNVDSGQGVRFRGNSVSDYSGTITVENNLKTEIRTTVAGPFSPIGTGKFILTCGAYNGGNALTCPTTGGYVELNLRNNSAGDTIFNNNIELTGSGAAMLNPLSDTPAPSNSVITMGNLKLGADQELVVYKGSGNPYTVKFNTVTLTGTATFSPKSPTFGAVAQTGSDLLFGDINQLAAGSGLIMNGLRTLTLTGNNGYSGDTTINNGTLALTGSSSLAGSPNITMGAATAVLDVSGRTDGTLSLGNTRTLSGHGTVRGALIASAGSTVSPGGALSAGLIGVTGAVTLAAGSTTIMEVDKANFTNDTISAASVAYNGTLQVVNIGTPYGAGNTFKLFSAGSYSGAFTIVPATPGPGFVWDITGLATNGTLKVRSTTPVTPPQIVTFGSSGTDVTLGGSGGPANGSYDVLTTTNLGLPASSWTVLGSNYFDASGNFSITVPIDTNEAYRFFVLRLP